MISVTPICLAAGAIMMYVHNSYYLHCDTRSVETKYENKQSQSVFTLATCYIFSTVSEYLVWLCYHSKLLFYVSKLKQ